MKLSGIEFKQLCEALGDAYRSETSLKHMVRFKLEENLQAIAGVGKLEDIIFNLVDWAETNGNLEQLIKGAYEENTKNSELSSIYKKYFPFSQAENSISSEQWEKLEAILPRIDAEILDAIACRTLKRISKNFEEHLAGELNVNDARSRKEIFLNKYPFNKNNVPTLLEFVERLANEEGVDRAIATQLQEWLTPIAREKGVTLPTYEKPRSIPSETQSHLLITIEKNPEYSSSEEFILQAELIPNYQKNARALESIPIDLSSDEVCVYPLDELKDAIYKLIGQAKSKLIREYRYIRNNTLTLELFLPIQYLDERFDLEKIPAGGNEVKEMGYQYRLVYRCLDRYSINEYTNFGDFLSAFENKWDTFQSCLTSSTEESEIQNGFVYLENSKLQEIHQWDEFSMANEWEKGKKVAVSATGCLLEQKRKNKLFQCLLRAGIPLSLWNRCSQLACADVERQFNTLLTREALQNLAQLFTNILHLRRDAHDCGDRAAEYLGYHLGFLCDRPDLIPKALDPGNQPLVGTD